jgi:hypothetical protein
MPGPGPSGAPCEVRMKPVTWDDALSSKPITNSGEPVRRALPRGTLVGIDDIHDGRLPVPGVDGSPPGRTPPIGRRGSVRPARTHGGN